jgi:hypothetical protein
MQIPSEYIISKVKQYTKRPIINRYNGNYNFECPICNEGKSAGKKRRGYYVPDPGYFYCHNCNQGWSPINWLKNVCNLTYKEIMDESSEYHSDIIEITNHNQKNDIVQNKTVFGTLPEDSINLNDPLQLKYYQNSRQVNLALQFIKKRRLDTAVNKPKTFWLSLKDYVHRDRLCIPFYDEDDQIRFYQTRTICNEDTLCKPKYLSKLNADKRIYGVNNITPDVDYLFLFEGPIDSMFVKNGLGIGGLNLTETQKHILNKYILYEKIWVLDNQIIDVAARDKTKELINNGQSVFIWPKKFKDFKDINDICVRFKLDQISPVFIKENSYKGIEAMTRLNLIL